MPRRVVIESPFAGNVPTNLRYLRAALHDCFLRGEAPYASHGLYTQPGVLDDGDPASRKQGIEAGFAWRELADATVVYEDLGITLGMNAGIEAAMELNHRQMAQFGLEQPPHAIEYRRLGADWEGEAIKLETTFKTKWP